METDDQPLFTIETHVVNAKPRCLGLRVSKRWKGRTFVYRKPFQWKVDYDWNDYAPEDIDAAVDYLVEAIDRQILDILTDKHGIGPVTRMLHKEGLIHHGDQSW